MARPEGQDEVRQILKDDGFYAAIGMATSAWSSFELAIDQAIWELAGTGAFIGACITAQLIGPARRLDALSSLVRLRGGSDALIKAINKFAQQTYGVAEDRNRLAHDSWFVNRKTRGVARMQVSAKAELKFGLVPLTLPEIEKIVANIDNHINAFLRLKERIHAELGALPDKPAPEAPELSGQPPFPPSDPKTKS